MQIMSKKDFVSKLIHQQYVNKLDKKYKSNEIDAYVSDIKTLKYKYKVNHSRRK